MTELLKLKSSSLAALKTRKEGRETEREGDNMLGEISLIITITITIVSQRRKLKSQEVPDFSWPHSREAVLAGLEYRVCLVFDSKTN